MKQFLTATLFAATATGAFAAPITMTMTASNITGSNLDVLGLSAGDMISSVATYDPDAPTDGPFVQSTPHRTFVDQSHYDADAVWSIGGTEYTANGSTDRVYVRDGIADGSSNINDFYQNQFYGMLNGIGGITYSVGILEAYDDDETLWDGLDPGADDLNAAASKYLYINFSGYDSNGAYFSGYVQSSNITFSAQPLVSVVAAVPLPASALMLGGALVGFAGLRRRRT